MPVLGVLDDTDKIIRKLSLKSNLPQRLVLVSSSIKSKEMSELMKISEKNGMKLEEPLPLMKF